MSTVLEICVASQAAVSATLSGQRFSRFNNQRGCPELMALNKTDLREAQLYLADIVRAERALRMLLGAPVLDKDAAGHPQTETPHEGGDPIED